MSRTYLKNKIICVGSGDNELHYYDLTTTAVDLSKQMRSANQNGKGWERLPKNNTHVKERIIERLLTMREMDGEGKLVIMDMFKTIWGLNLKSNDL